jgi:hypothetical protein
MAENIVASLFGLTPQMYGEQQRTSALAEGIRLAQLDPAARGAAMTYAGARGLGNAIGGAFGVEDPQLKLISARNAVAQQIDQTNPESILQGAQMLAQAGDQQGAMALAQYARQAQSEMALVQQRRAAEQSSLATAAKTQLSIDQETKLRDELSKLPQGTTQDDVIAVLTKYGPPEKVLAALTAAQSKTEATQAKTAASDAANQAKIDAAKTAADAALERAKVLADAKIEAARERGATALQIAQLQTQSKKDIAELAASLKAETARTKPLPAYLAKDEEADYGTATAATNLASDANNFIGRIKSGEIKFGLKDRASIRARQIVGSNDPDVLAREDYDKFLKVLTNESLRLNKGTQTEGDAVRAAKELESSESPQAAAAAMRRLLEINVRRAQNASDDVLRRRKNANFPEPERAIEVPKFDVQIIDNAEYQRFLKNPKFPSGTVFIDPEGQRRTKP